MSASNQGRVALVAARQTRFQAAIPELNYAELVHAPVAGILEDTGLSYADIETVITCSSDFFDGRTISDMAIQNVTGSVGKSASKVSNDGTFAMIYAWMRLLSGEFDCCLVVAHAKCSEGNQPLIENAGFDPLLLRHLGLTNLSASAMQARALLANGKYNSRDFARAAAHDLKCAQENPNAHFGGDYSPEDVMGSAMLADPIHRLETAPYSDGAACLLLVTEAWLEKRRWDKPVAWLKSVGYCTEGHYLGDRDLIETAALRQAARDAYSRAGVEKPNSQIDRFEISSQFSYQTPLWLEGLGCLEGCSFEKFLGENPSRINASGGLMGANPGFAAGLVRVIEAFNRIADHPGKLGLAHGTNGYLGQSHCVWILEAGSRS